MGEARIETEIAAAGITVVTIRTEAGSPAMTMAAEREHNHFVILPNDPWVGTQIMKADKILDKIAGPTTLTANLVSVIIMSNLNSSHVVHYLMANHLYCQHPYLALMLFVSFVINRDMSREIVLNVEIMYI